MDRTDIIRIKNRVSLVGLLGDYGIRLRRSQSRYVCRCPFSRGGDSNPSFTIYPETNTYKCYHCGEQGDVVSFVQKYKSVSFKEAVKQLASKCGICDLGSTAMKSRIQPCSNTMVKAVSPLKYISEDDVKKNPYTWVNNPLYIYLSKYFSSEKVKEVLDVYKCAPTEKNGWTNIFWLVDANRRYRQAKVFQYGTDGHRLRCIHYYREADGYRPCAFGEHLLAVYPDAERINVVESEKTAIVATLKFGLSKGLWLAVGGKCNLNYICSDTALPALYDKDIILYPDADAIKAWEDAIVGLRNKGLRAQISNIMSTVDPSTKYDVADLVIAAASAKESSLALSIVEETKEAPTITNPKWGMAINSLRGLIPDVVYQISAKEPELWQEITN